MTMNGAESLVRTLVGNRVDVCFTNPGTSEMHFVAALDRVEGMRCVLCLFEGVASGAADGYARMAEKPASTLFHLGPGLGNGLANLHNARRARSPVVNIVGEHATYHRDLDAPLTSDIEGIARPVSAWVHTSMSAKRVAEDGARAITIANTAPGQIATLILPGDTAWDEGAGPSSAAAAPARARVDDALVREAASALTAGVPALLLIGHVALGEKGLALAARISARTGCRVLTEYANARTARGRGRYPIERVPYPVDQALATLKDVRRIVRVGARAPVAFFAYPGKPGKMTHPDTVQLVLADPTQDLIDALERLADAVGAPRIAAIADEKLPAKPTGALNPESIAAALANTMPENAIICDESITTGRRFFGATHGAPPHDWLSLCGGSIGEGMPLAVGAAVACPDRPVLNLQADGSAMYTLQSLWTQAREGLRVVTLLWSNREYAILRHELMNVGANPGRKALDMLSLGNPDLDWVALAKGMGVPGQRVTTAEQLLAAIPRGLATQGPYLIEVML
jgi:acetolactate synthase-1/2/3 large subunit